MHPDYQGHGVGRRMLLTLTADRAERTAVLSTRDAALARPAPLPHSSASPTCSPNSASLAGLSATR